MVNGIIRRWLLNLLFRDDLRVRRDGLTGYGPEVLASELESSQGL